MSKSTQKTILLVEDEAIIAMTEKVALEKYGYSVRTVFTGEKAIEAVETIPDIDLVLMDINLGDGIDGTEAAQIILKDRDIPIVFVSSHSEREVVEKTEKITSYGYVVKNSSITVLDASIKMAFKLFDEKERFKAVNDKLEATFEALPDLIFEIGMDGYYYSSHSTHENLLYKPLDELVGRKIPDVLPGNISDTIMSAVAEAHAQGISQGKQYELDVPAGKRLFEITVSRTASFPDSPHFILLCRDITERKRVEDALRESEARMKNIVDSSPIGIHIYDYNEQGELIFVGANQSADRILGINNALLFGKTIQEAFPSLIGTEVPKQYVNTAISGQTWRTEQIDYKDNRINGAFEVVAFQTSKNKMAAYFFDITERKENERKLMDGEEKFSRIFKASPYPILMIDTENGFFTDMNEAMLRRVEYSREELLGKSAVELGIITPEAEVQTRRLIAEAGQYSDLEVMIKTKSGKVRFGIATGWVIEINRHAYIIQTIVDITERKVAEEALKESEEKYRLITEHSADVIWVLSLKNGRFKYVSPSIFHLRGLTPEEALCETWEDTMPPASIIAVKEAIASGYAYFIEHPDNPGSNLTEIQQYCKNGDIIWVEVSTFYYYNLEGDIEVLGTSRNIQERKEIEKELKDSELKVKSLLAEKELILKEVHHRIKNNINTISSLLSLRSTTIQDPSALMVLQDAKNRIQSMSLLYDRLFQSIDYTELSVKEYLFSLVDEIIANFPNSQNVKVEKFLQDFMMDPKRLQSLGIMINELLTNIMKYAFTGKDGGHISVSATRVKEQVIISIQDDGVGIPASISPEKSTGFGLQLVYALAQQLDGNIRIERDSGTKVIVEFGL